MENDNKIFKKNKYDLEYKVFGDGGKKMLVFHGFGQDNDIAKLMGELYKDYTILSVNLFYHNSSFDYNDKLELDPISIKYFVDLHESLIRFIFKDVKTISVLGYSIGGRLGSVFVENTLLTIEEFFLIAPDGYQFSFFYWFVTYTRMGLFMYYKTMKHIYGFKTMISFFKNTGIIPYNMYKFLIISIGLKRNRVLAPKIWRVYKELIINKHKLNKKLYDDASKTYVYLGIYDPVIKFKRVKRNLILFNLSVIGLKKGHSILSENFFKKTFKKVS